MPQSIANKTFRDDLYYRLNAFTVKIPPLRERKEEIPYLLNHFMSRFSENYARAPLNFSPRFIDACQRYTWPGNLRELSNFVKRYLILADEDWALNELRTSMQEHNENGSSSGMSIKSGLKSIVRSVKDEAEIQAISNALYQTEWNRKEAALLLNISYKALLYKIRQYNIDAPQPRRAPLKNKLHT
jgi:DNA-binding NtrC family response regulator